MAVNSFNAQNPPVTTKGDVFTFSTIPTRLGVGANDTVLTADSAAATGLKWAAAATPTTSYTLLNSGGTALTGSTTVTVSGISGKNSLLVIISGASSANADAQIRIRFNSDSGTNYNWAGSFLNSGSSWTASNMSDYNDTAGNFIPVGKLSSNAGSILSGFCFVDGTNSTNAKVFIAGGAATAAASSTNQALSLGGVYTGSSTISSVSIISSTGNLDAGTVYVYGA